MKFWRKLAVCSTVVAMLTGCSFASTDSGTITQRGSGPITVALTANLMTMDQTLANDGSSFSLLSTCMSGLTQWTPEGTVISDMADWEISEDGLTYSFHIFEDANWSNGEPVTAQDFVFSWQRLADPDTASEYSFILDTIHVKNAAKVITGELPVEELGIEAMDDKTFVVTLDLPCDFMLGLLAMPIMFPLNQAFFEAQGDQYGLGIDNILYNGAYTMTGWEEGSKYSFAKNPDYVHSADFPNEELVYRIVLETQTSILEYQQDNINLLVLNGEMVDQYKDDPGFHNVLVGTMWYLTLMLEDELVASRDFREFMLYAVDRDAIADSVLKNGSVPAEGIIGKTFTYENGVDFRDTAGSLTAYDVDKAKESWQKVKEEFGDQLSVELYYEDSDSAKSVAENIQQMFVNASDGELHVVMTSKPKKTRVEDMLNHEYQVMLTRWGPDFNDPQTFMDLFVTGADMNSGLYSNATYDELIEKGTKGEDAADSAKRWQDMIDAEKILIEEDIAIIPVYQEGNALMITPGVEGYIYTSGVSGVYRHLHWE